MTNEERVEYYLKKKFGSTKNIKPLAFYIRPDGHFFVPYGAKKDDEIKKELESLKNKRLLLKTVVVRVMDIAQFLPTVEVGRKIMFASDLQCRAGARRTAVDIWRIILNYRPDVSIFDVMRVLHFLVRTKKPSIITSYCYQINQRTFRLERSREHIYNPREDEFAIPNFSDWEYIGK